jgi:pimeloyl-ACP methyl ester carboxylesterase
LRSDTAAAPPDLTGRLGEITAPALIITGSGETPHRRRIAATLTERIPRARHVEIPGGGHLVNLTAPAAYNRILREFLDGISDPPSA